MSESPSLLTPLVAQLGIGGLGGLCVGYAVKNVAKIVAEIVGLFFLGLQYLAYQGIINDVDYIGLKNWANGLVSGAGALEGVLTAMIANLPFAASFTVGLAMGLKMSTGRRGQVAWKLEREPEQEKWRKRQLKRRARSDEEVE